MYNNFCGWYGAKEGLIAIFLLFPPSKTHFCLKFREKSDLQMCLMALRVMRYPLKLFFRQFMINLQQWLKLVWCQRRFKRDFPVVSPFKNSSFLFSM